ncbi:MAG: hypothetical protein OEY49_15785, partial [Candidatus Heimdallarchaeota archaeon]|nr:hypothetical protein [Candidatus Heimdallarchaeota archaeon]
MIQLDELVHQYFFDEEYTKLTLACEDRVEDPVNGELYKALYYYAKGNDEWEKSYNFLEIHEYFAKSYSIFSKLVENANTEDKLILNGFITLININDSAVNTENAMIFNDAVIMNKNSGQGKK